jgi:hypothetical protein
LVAFGDGRARGAAPEQICARVRFVFRSSCSVAALSRVHEGGCDGRAFDGPGLGGPRSVRKGI